MGFKEDFNSILAKKCAQLELIASRINKSKKSGTFYRYSNQKRNLLLSKFRKLTRKVDQLKWQMKLAAVGGTIAVLGNTHDAIAQSSIGPFVKQDRAHNPLRYPLEGDRLRPTIVDLDNDGDYDIVVGGYYEIKVYENVGDPNNPQFNDHYLYDETFSQLSVSGYVSPSFADLNGDGLLDLVIGITGSIDRIQYFVNNGGTQLGEGTGQITFTEQTGSWDGVAKTGNPFYGINPGNDSVPFFVDFDTDGDMDVFIGHDYSYFADNEQVHYYENDGQSNFTLGSFTPTPLVTGYNNYSATPTFADIDQDGNLDFIMGRHNGDVRFFKGNGTNFTEQTGPWNAVAKTGNPFDGIDFGYQSAAAFADLDNDGDLDMVIGASFNSYKYQAGDNYGLNYFVNQGNAVFERQPYLKNPLNGVSVGYEATPVLIDIDKDGDLDVVIGAKYASGEDDPEFDVYNNNNGVFTPDFESPIALVSLDGYNFQVTPSFVDIDNDGDLDLFVTADDETFFLRNNEGAFVIEESPIDIIAHVSSGYEARFSIAFMDLDGDGDFDAFIGSSTSSYYGVSKIDYVENHGTPEVPSFMGASEPTPFDTELFDRQARVSTADVDNDGDMDLVVAETIFDSVEKTNFRLFINDGNGSFTEETIPILGLEKISGRSSINLVDFDNDGDLDAFVGLGRDYNNLPGGIISYYENDNPAAIPTVSSEVLNYQFGSGALILDANLTLADQDNDNIIRATVSIQSFQPGNEVLTFTAQAPVAGNFNSTTGVLTLQGNASLAVYQSILRTVAYEYTGPDPGARKGSGRIKALARTIAFTVVDTDKTNGQSASRTVNIASEPKNPPVITQSNLNAVFNGNAAIDLNTIISDPDGNLDPQSFKVVPNVSPTPPSVGTTTISNAILTIDYSGTNFSGLDVVTIEACDTDGLCSTAELNIDVESLSREIIAHNGISPNGDGKNDYFDIENLTTLGAENKVSIFSRWGDKVFEVDNYDNSNRRFEGKSDGGKELSSGVYFYKIEFLNGQPELTGYLTIKR